MLTGEDELYAFWQDYLMGSQSDNPAQTSLDVIDKLLQSSILKQNLIIMYHPPPTLAATTY